MSDIRGKYTVEILGENGSRKPTGFPIGGDDMPRKGQEIDVIRKTGVLEKYVVVEVEDLNGTPNVVLGRINPQS